MLCVTEYNIDKSRIFELDCLRVLAILAVIMLHVSAGVVIANPQNSVSFLVGNFFDSVSRFAVPFFVMISGFFMLDESRELPVLKLKNKIIKLFILLIFWSCFYALIYNFHNFIYKFIYGHYHLWYMYLIIGLYLSLPILRLFVKKQNRNCVYYLILLGVIFLFLPNTLNAIFSPNKASELFNMFGLSGGGYFVYFLLGWVFRISGNKIAKYRKWLVPILILSLSSIFCCTQFVHSKYYEAYSIFYNSIGLPVLLYSVSLFGILYNEIKKHLSNVPLKIKQFISICSSLSLGVYLIHASFLHLYQSIFKHMSHDVIYVISIFCLTAITSFLAAYLISKIKFLNQLIRI